jgi:hypothetical protein
MALVAWHLRCTEFLASLSMEGYVCSSTWLNIPSSYDGTVRAPQRVLFSLKVVNKYRLVSNRCRCRCAALCSKGSDTTGVLGQQNYPIIRSTGRDHLDDVGLGTSQVVAPSAFPYISLGRCVNEHTFLGLLAKIKCSICSYQFNI